MRVAGHEEPVRERIALARAEADAHGHPGFRGRRDAVVDDADRPCGEVGAVERAIEAERLTEAARARARDR